MLVGDKLLILLFINILAFLCLIFKLIRRSFGIFNAFGLAWDLIVGDLKGNPENGIPKINWVPLLRKTWWIGNVLCGIYWLITPESFYTVIFGGLIFFHFIWYLLTLPVIKRKYDRTCPIDSRWGIMYKEIRKDSNYIQKSLAELDLRKKSLLILSIERDGEIISFPKGIEMILAGDRLIMFGDLDAYHNVFG